LLFHTLDSSTPSGSGKSLAEWIGRETKEKGQEEEDT